ARFQHRISASLQDTLREGTHGVVVFDEQNRLGPTGVADAGVGNVGARAAGIDAWQVDREAGAGTRFAPDLDAASALLDEPVHHGKPEPGALSGIFRREERL